MHALKSGTISYTEIALKYLARCVVAITIVALIRFRIIIITIES